LEKPSGLGTVDERRKTKKRTKSHTYDESAELAVMLEDTWPRRRKNNNKIPPKNNNNDRGKKKKERNGSR